MPHRLNGLTTTRHTSQSAAEAFLESLQQRVYGSAGLSAEDCQAREWVGQQLVLPARLQQKALELSMPEFTRYETALFEGLARDQDAPRPTRFERPHQYSIIRELKAAIERAAQRLAFELPVRPVIGTLPTRLLQPLMLPVPGTGDVVLVVDGGLLTYSHLLSKAVAQALPFDGTDGHADVPLPGAEWTSAIDPCGTGAERFVELMFASMDGNPASAPAYLPEDGYEAIAEELCDCMELFIVGREYGRLIQGDHLLAPPTQWEAHGEVFDALSWTGEQDLKADCVGLALMLSAAQERGASRAWAFWSADLLLASFDVLTRAAWMMRASPTSFCPEGYPVLHDARRSVLRSLVRQWDGGAAAIRFAASLQPVLDHLESALQSDIAGMRFGPLVEH